MVENVKIKDVPKEFKKICSNRLKEIILYGSYAKTMKETKATL